MTTTLTPPPPSGRPAAPAPDGPHGPRASSTVVAILVIVFGALVIAGTVIGTAFSTVRAAAVSTQVRATDAAGVDALSIELNAGSLTIEFADVDEAELEVTSAFGADKWTLERTGGTLEVASPRWEWGAPWMFGGSGDAVLRIPERLEGLDARVDMAAGSLDAAGDFGELVLGVGAGEVDVVGAADSVNVDLSAGRATLDLGDVETAELTVAAGSMDAVFTGAQPDDVSIDVSAGSLTLGVPEGTYDVTSDVSAGEFRNRLGTDPGADSSISVRVSAGQVVLRPAP